MDYPPAPDSILWPPTGEQIPKLPLRGITDHVRGATLPDVAQYQAPRGAIAWTRKGYWRVEHAGFRTRWHLTLDAAIGEMSEVLP